MAKAIISGAEVLHMMKKKQVYQKVQSFQGYMHFIHKLFEIAT
ncbi:hypothetical protein ABEW47_18355 [Priestia megaterium]